jgi:hypothetical protein
MTCDSEYTTPFVTAGGKQPIRSSSHFVLPSAQLDLRMGSCAAIF